VGKLDTHRPIIIIAEAEVTLTHTNPAESQAAHPSPPTSNLCPPKLVIDLKNYVLYIDFVPAIPQPCPTKNSLSTSIPLGFLVDEGQQKLKIVCSNQQSNFWSSCQSIFSLSWHHPSE